MSGVATQRSWSALARFVYDEARLVDEKRFDEWYDLFTEDAYYWMPLTRGQPDGENHTSLLYEDKLLLQVRIERLKNPHSFSQHQPSFCQHVLQAPQLESAGPERQLMGDAHALQLCRISAGHAAAACRRRLAARRATRWAPAHPP